MDGKKIGIRETPSTRKLIEFATSAALADSEADVASMLLLVNPVNDREKMGTAYNEVLGYNPITAFDAKDIERIVNEMELGSSLESLLKGKKEDIIDRAVEIYEDCRESNLAVCVAIAAREIVGNADDRLMYATQALIDDYVNGKQTLQARGRYVGLDTTDNIDSDDDDEDELDDDEEGVELFDVDDDMESSLIDPVEGEEFMNLCEEDDDED